MISKLFKPAWEHKDPDRRLAAINSFSEDNSEQQEILQGIAQSDADARVREGAISRLTNLRNLEQLRTSEYGDKAQERLNELISSKDDRHQSLISDFVSAAEPQTLLSILCHCPNSDARSTALIRLTDDKS